MAPANPFVGWPALRALVALRPALSAAAAFGLVLAVGGLAYARMR